MAIKKRNRNDLPTKRAAFLDAYAKTCNISEAARIAGVSRQTHYKWLEIDPDYSKDFAAAHQLACEALESEIARRAVEGDRELVIYNGRPIFVWVDIFSNVVEETDPERVRREPLYKTKKSDTLLIFRAKAEMPEKYREKYEIIHGSIDAEIERLLADLAGRSQAPVEGAAADGASS